MTTLVLRVALVGFAAFRLARALTLDRISDPLRAWVHRHAFRVGHRMPAGGGAHEEVIETKSRTWSWCYGLVSCPHCASWWIALGLAVAWFGTWTVTFGIAAVAAAGLASALVSWTEPA